MLQEEAEDSAVRDDLVKKKQKSSEPDMIAAGYICSRIWTNLKRWRNTDQADILSLKTIVEACDYFSEGQCDAQYYQYKCCTTFILPYY